LVDLVNKLVDKALSKDAVEMFTHVDL